MSLWFQFAIDLSKFIKKLLHSFLQLTCNFKALGLLILHGVTFANKKWSNYNNLAFLTPIIGLQVQKERNQSPANKNQFKFFFGP